MAATWKAFLRTAPLRLQVRQGQLATAEGVSYLEAKHLLLLHYCIALVFYLLLKAEGRPVRDHPVIARLVRGRQLFFSPPSSGAMLPYERGDEVGNPHEF